jgi:hypothetical protein
LNRKSSSSRRRTELPSHSTMQWALPMRPPGMSKNVQDSEWAGVPHTGQQSAALDGRGGSGKRRSQANGPGPGRVRLWHWPQHKGTRRLAPGSPSGPAWLPLVLGGVIRVGGVGAGPVAQWCRARSPLPQRALALGTLLLLTSFRIRGSRLSAAECGAKAVAWGSVVPLPLPRPVLPRSLGPGA